MKRVVHKVTAKDVRDAALIAEIAAQNHIDVTACLQAFHCETCSCEFECGHIDFWDCVAAAVGASAAAVDLYLRTSSVVTAFLVGELDLDGSYDDADRKASYDSLYERIAIVDDDNQTGELESAALLRDGWLPAVIE
jgi:hypothetical protein